MDQPTAFLAAEPTPLLPASMRQSKTRSSLTPFHPRLAGSVLLLNAPQLAGSVLAYSPNGVPILRSDKSWLLGCGTSSRRRAKLNFKEAMASTSKTATVLWCVRTPEEAAEAYTRYIGTEAVLRIAAEMDARTPPPRPMTTEEAIATAEREGLVLLPNEGKRGSTAYKHVMETAPGKFMPLWRPSKDRNVGGVSLGLYATAAEAALVHARTRARYPDAPRYSGGGYRVYLCRFCGEPKKGHVCKVMKID